MRKFVLALGALVLLSVNMMAITAQTLPQGLWSFQLHNSSYAINRVATARTDGLPQWISVPDFKISGIQVADDVFYSNTYLDVAYGLTSDFMVFTTFRYVTKKLDYSDAYVSALTQLNGVNDAGIIVPPDEVNTNGFGDITVGFEYKLLPNFAIAASYSGGFLLTGKDYTEISAATDGHQELNTGNRNDTTQLGAFYDTRIGDLPLYLGAIYEIYGPGGWERVLGNDFETDPGDKLKLTVGTQFNLHPQWDLNLTWDAIFIAPDKERSSGSYVEIAHSGTQANTLETKLIYKPYRFLNAFVSYRAILDHQAALGLFEMPGKIDPAGTAGLGGMYQFGIQLFYR